MGQSRTAIVLGIKPSQYLIEFMRIDRPGTTQNCFDEDWCPLMLDSGLLAFPIAVAHDPPDGCAEIAFPCSLTAVYDDPKYTAATRYATGRWKAFAVAMKALGRSVPRPMVYLDQVERS